MKTYQSWLLGALACATIVPFTGCTKDEMVGPNGGDGETVKTQFAINIPYAGKPETKMSGANTQQDGTTFLGMQNIRLIPYADASWYNNINTILALSNIESTNGVTDKKTQKIYSDVNIPIGTDHFLFYGEAYHETQNKVEQGVLKATLDGQTSRDNIKFELEQISDGSNLTEETLILGLLNRVDDAFTQSGSGGNFDILNNLQTKLKEMKVGSAQSVLSLMQSLYRSLSFANEGGDGSSAEKIAYNIRQAIIGTDNLKIKVESGDNGKEILAYDTQDFDNTYPKNYNLPDGVVRVKYETDGFVSDNTGSGVSSENMKIAELHYPASLYYFIESGIKTSTSTTAEYPSGWTGWSSDWTENPVSETTRSIAMVNNVQYGVAMLATAVRCDGTSLIDHNGSTINLGTNGFAFTGVLVGSQPNNVVWNMVPTTSNGSKVVFDAAVPADLNITGGTYTAPNYTLVLDNTSNGAYNNSEVKVVIELVNNTGNDFVGIDGTIFNGAKFYLVATLNPTTITSNTDKSVFMKDYVTKANLTITSLKNAYNGIPDLGAAGLRLGLSVDLEWQQGLEFNVDIE